MKTLGLSQEDAHSKQKWTRKIKEEPANSCSPGKWILKQCKYAGLFNYFNSVLHNSQHKQLVALQRTMCSRVSISLS